MHLVIDEADNQINHSSFRTRNALAGKMSTFIVDALDKAKKVQVTFEDLDTFIIIVTAGNRAGVGLITRAMRERYHFIRAK